jgi:hypothetical protein
VFAGKIEKEQKGVLLEIYDQNVRILVEESRTLGLRVFGHKYQANSVGN